MRQSGSRVTIVRPGRLERALRAADLDPPAVQLGQQIVEIGGDQIDDVIVQGVGRRQGGGLAYGLLGPVDVAPAQLGERADVGDRVVDDLVLHAGDRRLVRRGALIGLIVRLARLTVLAGLLAGAGGCSGAGSGPPGKPPPIWTGVAAPRLVPGAIAATWQA